MTLTTFELFLSNATLVNERNLALWNFRQRAHAPCSPCLWLPIALLLCTIDRICVHSICTDALIATCFSASAIPFVQLWTLLSNSVNAMKNKCFFGNLCCRSECSTYRYSQRKANSISEINWCCRCADMLLYSAIVTLLKIHRTVVCYSLLKLQRAQVPQRYVFSSVFRYVFGN